MGITYYGTGRKTTLWCPCCHNPVRPEDEAKMSLPPCLCPVGFGAVADSRCPHHGARPIIVTTASGARTEIRP